MIKLIIMSEISELIEIGKNIVSQNEEIIRLLKKIAGEEDSGDEEPFEYVVIGMDEDEKEDEIPEDVEPILDTSHETGEVCFIEGADVFRLTVGDNETKVDNLTGDEEPNDFAIQEFAANESIKINQPLPDGTVLLNSEQAQNLSKTLQICVNYGAKNVFVPGAAMLQLVGAPPMLMTLIKIDFYKTEEELLRKLFS